MFILCWQLFITVVMVYGEMVGVTYSFVFVGVCNTEKRNISIDVHAKLYIYVTQ